MLYINFKTYTSGSGEEAERMAEMMIDVERRTGVEITPVVQSLDLYRVGQQKWDWAWCQHADPIEMGANSGWLLPEGVKRNGAHGVMVNHAERKIRGKIFDSRIKESDNYDLLKETVTRCRAVGLAIGICADSLAEVEIVMAVSPDWIAYEPPELIGNSEVSVATAKPEVVRSAVEMVGEIPLLIGAGIHDASDIRMGLQLGAKGFLLASAVMKAEDSRKVLEELVEGYK